MKIAYNFAFQQAGIMYFYLCFNFQEIAVLNAKY